MDAPEAVLSVQLTEACGTIEPMTNLLEGREPVVLANSGLMFRSFGLSQIQREPSGLWG